MEKEILEKENQENKDESTKEQETIDETVQEVKNLESSETTQEETVSEDVEPVLNDEEKENLDLNDEALRKLALENIELKKKVRMRLIKILIGFVLATIVYYVCKVFDPFKNLQDNAEVQTNQMFKYIKYIMFVSSMISAVGLVLAFLSKFKIVWEMSTKGLKILVEICEWIVILPICIAISSFLFSFVFTITVVDGTSMAPTLLPDEQLVLTYDNSYERFDIVVIDVDVSVYKNLQTIYNSNSYQTLYVKRIIGLPGDYIEYREIGEVTYLYINGVQVEETFFNGNIHNTYYESLISSYPFSWKHVCDISAEKCVDNGSGQLVIPEGYYFVLGDNRTNSVDSRKMGLVKEEDIIGIIKYRMTSFLNFEKVK